MMSESCKFGFRDDPYRKVPVTVNAVVTPNIDLDGYRGHDKMPNLVLVPQELQSKLGRAVPSVLKYSNAKDNRTLRGCYTRREWSSTASKSTVLDTEGSSARRKPLDQPKPEKTKGHSNHPLSKLPNLLRLVILTDGSSKAWKHVVAKRPYRPAAR